jgi:predicted dehydrogenase
VVQVGTQRRSFDLFLEARQIIESGALGEVRLVTSQWLDYAPDFRERKLEGKLDWNRWLGPAPKRELDPFRFFSWYYFWDYSGGLLVGQAAHIIDAIQWLMKQEYPAAVTCSGARPNLQRVEVPETATILIEYPDNLFANFTLGYRAMKYNYFLDQWKQFHGNKARFDVGREWYALYPQSRELELKPSIEKKQPGSFGSATRAHIRNFLDCIRSRKDPNAPVEVGQSTNIVLAMAMESLRSGRRIRYNPSTRRTEV